MNVLVLRHSRRKQACRACTAGFTTGSISMLDEISDGPRQRLPSRVVSNEDNRNDGTTGTTGTTERRNVGNPGTEETQTAADTSGTAAETTEDQKAGLRLESSSESRTTANLF